MEYYSVFESINKNCITIHGTIDEICNSSAVIDMEDSLIELIDMTDRFMKEIKIEGNLLQKKSELVSLLFENK